MQRGDGALADGVWPVRDRTAWARVQIRLRPSTAALDPEIEVLDPTGAIVTTPAWSGHANNGALILCTLQANLTPALTGTYAVCTRDNGANNVGAYEIDL